ncbi:hypothetical protein C0W92_09435 [Photobacterium angustum]|uniref:Fimbrial-type adhesion domain-containing protein n=1 Tax=Photobacterium angustum TaxID=661 RepID=A0A855SDZ7_PHOAN|nr:fimbrial protein [Photobacterium angustum]KJF82122.1 hypothetical protein UB36_08925 [Photobacterium damselae subsp. damselae]KJG00452.1 hypothetical protein UB35_18195 [Photobacterium angustum]KJG15677.1 hypothetical protein UA33_18445 [Photobacterium angustum]KJG21169.1 hypothetical protein UA39_18240 [Photobacterium angustum]KJG31186.1 hypothetical protein UA69_09045 [Photobacterium angustum]
MSVNKIAFAVLLLSSNYAIAHIAEVTVNISGNIISPGCTVNSNNDETVDFETVDTGQVITGIITETVPVVINCARPEIIDGINIKYDPIDTLGSSDGILSTNKDELGIKLLVEGNNLVFDQNYPIPIGTETEFIHDVTATLIYTGNGSYTDLNAGEFTSKLRITLTYY